MKIAGVDVGGSAPCRVIAELSNAHNGSIDRAYQLMDAVKQAGADFVKIQAYSVDDLIRLRGDGPAPEPWASQGFTMRTLYEKAQTPLEWLPDLFAYAAAIELPIFSSVFGVDGFAMLERVGNRCYKLAALDVGAEAVHAMVLRTGKPIIQSLPDPHTGRAIAGALTLYCPEGYPQPAAELANIRNGFDGYSYHGTDPSVPTFAVACGAKLVEVHVQLESEPSELERDVSLGTRALAMLVHGVRRAERMVAA